MSQLSSRGFFGQKPEKMGPTAGIFGPNSRKKVEKSAAGLIILLNETDESVHLSKPATRILDYSDKSMNNI